MPQKRRLAHARVTKKFPRNHQSLVFGMRRVPVKKTNDIRKISTCGEPDHLVSPKN